MHRKISVTGQLARHQLAAQESAYGRLLSVIQAPGFEFVRKQFLEPNRIYEFEVLATEKGGNQTITEGGAFCTPPIAAEDCELP